MFKRSVLLAGCIVSFTLAISGAHAQNFTELKPGEQKILQPLQGEWDSLSSTRKKKWRELAARYPSLTAEEQARLSERMQGWSQMSPNDRRAARDQFREINKANAPKDQNREELKRKWNEYRELPAEKRQELTRSGQGRVLSPEAQAAKRSGTVPLPSSTTPQPPTPPAVQPRPQPGSNAAQR